MYQPDETIRLEVRMDNETVWLTQAQMAELFQRDQSVIARHISNVFNEKELTKESNMQILHNTLSRYKPTTLYNLDVIISVGYRVKSKRGTMFRQWANNIFLLLPDKSKTIAKGEDDLFHTRVLLDVVVESDDTMSLLVFLVRGVYHMTVP